MTTIVYDGKTLAADTAEWVGDTYVGTVSKVKKVKTANGEFLVAGSGMSADFYKFCDLFEKGEDIYTFEGSRFICVNTLDPIVFFGYELGAKVDLELPLVIGCGRDVAYGALDAGCDALGAVKVACKRNAFTDYPIDTYTFDVDKFIYARIYQIVT